MNQTSETMAEEAESGSSSRLNLSTAVGKAARLLDPESALLDSGEKAELRRISPARPVTPALWRVLIQLGEQEARGWISQERWETRWATLLMGMAHCTGLHDYGTPLGAALAAAGWSETRFVRLMEARDETLAVHLRRMAQYLASKQQPANWADAARLLFRQSGETADEIRLDVARAYYGRLYAENQEE
jgi:CRISPR system Cascade subunit CasB